MRGDSIDTSKIVGVRGELGYLNQLLPTVYLPFSLFSYFFIGVNESHSFPLPSVFLKIAFALFEVYYFIHYRYGCFTRGETE